MAELCQPRAVPSGAQRVAEHPLHRSRLGDGVVVGVGGFIVLGYVVGFLVAAGTLFDMGSYSRSTWRTTGRRRRTWELCVVLGWVALGWGAVLVSIVWFAGEARNQVRQALVDLIAEREIDLELEDRKATIAAERRTIDLTEAPAERD
jgi:hypothetical protein